MTVNECFPKMALINRLLPAEMLEKVFQFLCPRDLKAVVLVCKWWNDVAELPMLWIWVCLRITSWNIDYMPELLNSRRLQAVRSLKSLELTDSDLSSITANILSNMIIQIEVVKLKSTILSTQQVEAICTASNSINSKLKKLDLTGNNISAVNVRILAQTKVKELELRNTELTAAQVEGIFDVLNTRSEMNMYFDNYGKMKKLGISRNNLCLVNADMIARAVIQLEEMDLGCTCLTFLQVITIFYTMTGSSQPKLLDLSWNNLSSVDSDVLNREANRILMFNTQSIKRPKYF